VEFLPRKTYSLPVIEKSCRLYLGSACGLRKAVEKIKGISPHYSTLHGWLGALGERALDRVLPSGKRNTRGQHHQPPTSSIIAETAKRLDPGLVNRWTERKPKIAKSKYQSELRKERLQGCHRLLSTAASLFDPLLYPLSRWNHYLLTYFHVPVWGFMSRGSLTAIQLDDYTGTCVSSRRKKQPVRVRSP
jgi:hypothetical protein